MDLGGKTWVTYYQQSLRKKGYNPGPIDGRYGKGTKRAFTKCIKRGCKMGAK